MRQRTQTAQRPAGSSQASGRYSSAFSQTQDELCTRLAAAAIAVAILTSAGCAVSRGQEPTGAYIDDATIATLVKRRMLDNPSMPDTSIGVETLNGTLMLSGFAKNATEKDTAERIARDFNGVKAVRNEFAIRP